MAVKHDKYLGPAGIFSTDDAGADLRQLEEEQFDPFEGEEPFDEVFETEYLFASCSCGWSGTGMCWKNDEEDTARAFGKLYMEHDVAHPECTLTPSIG